jgi:hypothetical protein
MRVFISWSGDRSKAVAHTLREWLPAAISSINPWMSDDDILSGSRWNDEIKQQLASADVGVLCLTKENLAAPWLLFEAGALSRRSDGESYVIPYLVDLQIREIPAGPLTAFHAICANEKGTKSLLRTMNAAISKNPGEPVLESVTFERVFTNNWPSLEADLKRIAEDPSYEATPKNEGPTLTDMVA